MLLYACGMDCGIPIVNVLVAVQEVILAMETPGPRASRCGEARRALPDYEPLPYDKRAFSD